MKMKRHKCVDSMFCSDFFLLSTRLSIPLFAFSSSAISGDFFGTAAVFVAAAAISLLYISYEMEKNLLLFESLSSSFFHATIFHLSHEIGMNTKPKSHRTNFYSR